MDLASRPNSPSPVLRHPPQPRPRHSTGWTQILLILHHKIFYPPLSISHCFLITVPSKRIQPGLIKASEGCNRATAADNLTT